MAGSGVRWALTVVAALALAGCGGPTPPSTRAPDAVPATSSPASTTPSADATSSPSPSSPPSAPVATTPGASDTPSSSPTPTPGEPFGPWRAGEGVAGFDVSRYQPEVDWAGLVAEGHRFVYIKATEGRSHVSPTHAEQRAGATSVGLLLGGYHYARPGGSAGAVQARFFVDNGGGWTPDRPTMPGALDLEFNDSGERCYGLTPRQMTAWVRDFSDEYRRLTGRVPVIYTKAEVWDACTGGDTGFGDHPLWLYDHADVPGVLPTGWERPTLWQRGIVDDLDRNVFFGSGEQLGDWAAGPVR